METTDEQIAMELLKIVRRMANRHGSPDDTTEEIEVTTPHTKSSGASRGIRVAKLLCPKDYSPNPKISHLDFA